MSRFKEPARHIEWLVQRDLGTWPTEWVRFIYPGYVYEHTLRVRNLCVSIARRESASEEIVELAGLLHDIGRPTGEPHAQIGAKRAESILSDHGFDRDTRTRVCHAIETHLTVDSKHPIENRILRDADFMDANCGYVGYLRFILIRAYRGETVDQIFADTATWLEKRQDWGMYNTPTAQSIAQVRYTRLLHFVKELEADLQATPDREGFSLGIVRYVMADAEHPSLLRQVKEMEGVVERGESIRDLESSLFLREFSEELKQEISGQS